MIEGKVTVDGVPMISLKVAKRTYRAVVDTGFNGDLELPEKLRMHVNPRLVGQATSSLAGGLFITEDVYLVDLAFDKQVVKAEATFVGGDEILIGTRLLYRYRLEINFVKRTLRMEVAE